MSKNRPIRRGAIAVATAFLLGGSLLVAATTQASAGQAQSQQQLSGQRQVGTWTVTLLGPDTYRIAWRSPKRLPVTSDRPQIRKGGESLGVALIERDGRTVYVDVRSTKLPDTSSMDVVLSGDRLNVGGDDVLARVNGNGQAGKPPALSPSRPKRTTTVLPEDPAEPGPFGIRTSDYELDPVKLPGMKQPIEMVGHVVEPTAEAATGPRPVVLFLHGRHSYCYNPDNNDDGWEWPCQAPLKEIPSHLGYDYIQQALASQGYFTVSVRVNGINAQDWKLDDGGADARAQIVERHLDHWAAQAAGHELDMSQVVLVGHSRGGEGVDRAALEIPLTAPYTIAGQVLLAPTDFAGQTAAYVPTVTVLPYCDGDVYDLQGQIFTDAARDLVRDDTSLKSSILVMGANHNFFNTEWTPGLAAAPAWDDWGGPRKKLCGEANPDRLSPTEQQAVGTAYVSGAVHLFTRDEQEFLPMYDGSAVSVSSIGDAEVLSHAIGGGRELRRPGIDSGLSLTDGAQTQLCLGAYSWGNARHGLCGRAKNVDGNVPHWSADQDFLAKRQNLEVYWTAPGQAGGLVFDDTLDLSGPRRLELRTIVDPTVGDASFHVRLTDADGNTAEVTPEGGSVLPALPVSDWLGKRWAQTVIVDPAAATGINPTIDLGAISQVELVGQNARGRVWVLDIASSPEELAAVPDKRLPVISLGNVTVPEGNKRNVTASVPFTISGTLTRRATVAVGVLDYETYESPQLLTLDLAPGQTSGSIIVDYSGDKIDGPDRKLTMLSAFPRTGVMTDRYNGRLIILDDDPTPKVKITPAKKTVKEGTSVEWVIKLDKRISQAAEIQLRPVAGGVPGPKVTVGDLPRDWLRKHGVRKTAATTPLHKTNLSLYSFIRPGRTSATIKIPIRADQVKEGREALSFRITVWLGGKSVKVTKTVYIQDKSRL